MEYVNYWQRDTTVFGWPEPLPPTSSLAPKKKSKFWRKTGIIFAALAFDSIIPLLFWNDANAGQDIELHEGKFDIVYDGLVVYTANSYEEASSWVYDHTHNQQRPREFTIRDRSKS